MYEEFEKELQALLNKYSMENPSNTPDFILAAYLSNCLRAFNLAHEETAKWTGSELKSYQVD